MSFYLLKDEEVTFFGILDRMFVSSAIIKPNYEKFCGSFSATDYQKMWNVVTEAARKARERSTYFLMQMEFLTSLRFSRRHYDSTKGKNMVQVGIHGSLLTQAMVDVFGENEVCLELSISHLRQGQIIYKHHIISPDMPIKPTNDETKFACTTMGPTSWFAGIEDSAIPKANMDVKIVVSTKGMENLRNFHLE